MEVLMSETEPFIDCHCHAFWDFDDGVRTKEDALELLRCAQRTGISEIFVTPHLIIGGLYEPDFDLIKSKLKRLIQLRDDNGLFIRLKYASEFRINALCFDAIESKSYVCYENTDWILIEFTRGIIDSEIIKNAVSTLSKNGVRILIAHPERYFDSEKQAVEKCRLWQSWGCFFQINRTSLIGYHGERADKISWRLISEGLANIVASDAHQGEGKRECRLDDVHAMLVRRFGRIAADTLCIENPTLLSQNKELLSISVYKAWWHK
jgi:protein-tyrosine phosphatase